MFNIQFEFAIAVPAVNPQEIVRLLNALGARFLGVFAEKCPHFGKGYRYIGNIIQIGTLFFTFTWDNENCKISLNPIAWKDDYVQTNFLPIQINGSQSGDTALFASKEDAVAWLKNMSSIEQLKLSVKTDDYTGPAVMFLAQE